MGTCTSQQSAPSDETQLMTIRDILSKTSALNAVMKDVSTDDYVALLKSMEILTLNKGQDLFRIGKDSRRCIYYFYLLQYTRLKKYDISAN